MPRLRADKNQPLVHHTSGQVGSRQLVFAEQEFRAEQRQRPPIFIVLNNAIERRIQTRCRESGKGTNMGSLGSATYPASQLSNALTPVDGDNNPAAASLVYTIGLTR